MRTRTRALFTHGLRVQDVEEFISIQDSLPWKMSEGTLHHVFDGGWLWVIPFNNHKDSKNELVSVGLMLDPDRFPVDLTIPPEEDFKTFITRFPTLAKQFSQFESVMPWVRTPGAIQFRSSQSMGKRWALLGSANGFVDPLFSKGLYHTFVSVSLLNEALLSAVRSNGNLNPYSPQYNTVMNAYISSNDRLVSYAYKSFSHDKLWKIYQVIWLLGAFCEYVKLISNRAFTHSPYDYNSTFSNLRMVGGGFEGFNELKQEIHTLFDTLNFDDLKENNVLEVYSKSKDIICSSYWVPDVFKYLLSGKTYLPKRKLRIDLLDKNHGFMKTGAFKTHFFGDANFAELAQFFIQESIKNIR